MTVRHFANRAHAALFLLASSGCQVGTEPGSLSDLTFRASMSRTLIAVGETATLTIRLRNNGSQPVTIDFPHSCQILPYIDTVGGEPAFPAGGGWGCLTVVTKLHLEPGEEIVQAHEIRGAPAPAIYTGALLPPGEYRAYAELGERPRPLGTTNAIRFTVVD